MMFYELVIESFNLTLLIENYLKWIIAMDKNTTKNCFIYPNYLGIEPKYSGKNYHK